MKTKYTNQKHKIIQIPKQSKQFLDSNYKENTSNYKEYFHYSIIYHLTYHYVRNKIPSARISSIRLKY